MFENKIIMVFGGTGTIGSAIVEYLLKTDIKTIRIFSNDENSLWETQQKFGNHKIRYLLGDIRNLERIKRSLKGVNYVFNCAAIKHVPFAEYNPMEAVGVNIKGLSNIIDGCVYNDVEKLLHISTDKVCYASSVMGATKLIGESLLQMRSAQNPEVDMVCVRSGNVYNSRGSIIPYINECIRMRKNVNITDIKMERYFISIKNLITFIMKTFTEGNHGDIWIPKLKSTKIIDLISDLPYTIIGRKKGEKLKEFLFTNEESLNLITKKDCYIIKNELWH